MKDGKFSSWLVDQLRPLRDRSLGQKSFHFLNVQSENDTHISVNQRHYGTRDFRFFVISQEGFRGSSWNFQKLRGFGDGNQVDPKYWIKVKQRGKSKDNMWIKVIVIDYLQCHGNDLGDEVGTFQLKILFPNPPKCFCTINLDETYNLLTDKYREKLKTLWAARWSK